MATTREELNEKLSVSGAPLDSREALELVVELFKFNALNGPAPIQQCLSASKNTLDSK